MTHYSQHHSLSLLLGAAALILVLGLISSRSEAQFTAAPQPIGNWWPPHPRDQVQVGNLGSQVDVPKGGAVQVYQVPQDRWLVLVPTRIDCALGLLSAGYGKVFLAEDRFGLVTRKATAWDQPIGHAGPTMGGALGWTFAPGSRVLIQNEDTVDHPVTYNLFGYLAPL
jgi:hypothetical protein